MEKHHGESFELVNLKNRSDVMERITQTEQELNRLLKGRVALIAYVQEDEDN
ncbi:hypothetical protein [Paludifilum halophilum]|uniref:hypothetical protein n=1 Tax=Paludifilum halophilum TaxID=1642702 RepID=UPI00146ABE42|nr:hypothetical protein [Paludifilum halophilum]